ncbi:MAG: triose-phosphate isomerase [Clostridiales bacterium]|jgi:triosephosphate isomerase|nr:triose-phosphate isomerase [Clostridiales bacterium]
MRKKVVAGNWKMNMTPSDGAKFAAELAPKLNTDNAEAVFCVPYTDIAAVAEAIKETNVGLGAQNLHYEDKGAFTGEITAAMLMELGVRYVIIGHSERREYYAETDEAVNKKLKKALEAGLTPIVCVGESLIQREQNITADWLRMQVRIAFLGIPAEAVPKTVIAYEPIWAIGTGKVATNEQAQEACAVIRQLLTELYGKETAEATRILYGGSVNADNAKALFAMDDIDGGLVGGASIKPEFEKIVNGY